MPSLQKKDPFLFDKLVDEIPAFMHFLINRTMKYPEPQERMWFPMKELEQQVADGQAKLDTVIKDSYSKTEVSRMLEEKDKEIQTLKKISDSTINTMQKEINHLKSENRRLLSSLYDAAKILLTRFTSETISIFERVGLPEVLGQRIWNRVKDFETPREALGQKNGRGLKM